jgi:hypothetical protein
MLCFMGIRYMMVDIICLEQGFWRLCAVHIWLWLMGFNEKDAKRRAFIARRSYPTLKPPPSLFSSLSFLLL